MSEIIAFAISLGINTCPLNVKMEMDKYIPKNMDCMASYEQKYTNMFDIFGGVKPVKSECLVLVSCHKPTEKCVTPPKGAADDN